MTPVLRQAVFDLPLCDGSLDKPTGFAEGRKYKFLLEVQRLLVFLQEADTRAWSTEELTKAFGWGGGQGQEQQDIHELNRVLFDALEKALTGTPYDSLIKDLYFGEQASIITCTECGTPRKGSEPFLDLALQVEGVKGVEEALQLYFSDD